MRGEEWGEGRQEMVMESLLAWLGEIALIGVVVYLIVRKRGST